MGFAKKKPDPISEKERVLNAQIAALTAEIKKLDSEATKPSVPKYRSTALPRGETIVRPAEKIPPTAPAGPVFEEVSSAKINGGLEPGSPEIYNELGVRKYDLPALWHRIRNHFRGPSTSNPRLVNYLAAGGVHGLRPLRYEKRIARNRFLWLVLIVSVVLFGLFYVLLPKH
jgi:hypothetical protein